MTKAGLDSASSEMTGPVLFVKNDAGPVLVASAQSGLSLLTIDDVPDQLPSDALVAFDGLDAAVGLGLRVRRVRASGAVALVLIQDWQGHDPAMRGFNLMFVEHRLIASGFSAVRFVDLSGADEDMPDWAAELDIVHTARPAPAGGADPDADREALWPDTVALLICEADADPGALVAAAELRAAERGGRLLVVCDQGVALPADFPATIARFDPEVISPHWLAERAGLLAATGADGWRRAFVEAAEARAATLLGLGGRSGEPLTAGNLDPGTDMAGWLRTLAGGVEARADIRRGTG